MYISGIQKARVSDANVNLQTLEMNDEIAEEEMKKLAHEWKEFLEAVCTISAEDFLKLPRTPGASRRDEITAEELIRP